MIVSEHRTKPLHPLPSRTLLLLLIEAELKYILQEDPTTAVMQGGQGRWVGHIITNWRLQMSFNKSQLSYSSVTQSRIILLGVEMINAGMGYLPLLSRAWERCGWTIILSGQGHTQSTGLTSVLLELQYYLVARESSPIAMQVDDSIIIIKIFAEMGLGFG